MMRLIHTNKGGSLRWVHLFRQEIAMFKLQLITNRGEQWSELKKVSLKEE